MCRIRCNLEPLVQVEVNKGNLETVAGEVKEKEIGLRTLAG